MDDFAPERLLPFAALVGQAELKLALLMQAANPLLGGLLIRGERGTAKSTAARALASLMPAVRVVDGCPFGCPSGQPELWCSECQTREQVTALERPAPFCTLPLGVTEDQLLGTIDLQHALQKGERRFQPGILARVNQGLLYVDEVNLLDDHIVDLLLDAAAMGVNVVAREGIRVSHPARFALIGTMNPEEGELRPQLLDRFGLCVEIRSLDDAAERAEVVERSLAFEADPERFRQRWAAEEQELAQSLVRARELLAGMRPDRAWALGAARVSLALGIEGHRADLLMVKAAATAAALAGRSEIEAADLERAAPLAVRHRLRRRPFEEQALGEGDLREKVRSALVEPAAKKKP